jgi:hypothetical protein
MSSVDSGTKERILIDHGPQTVQGALMNIRAFSDEFRQRESQINRDADEGLNLRPPPPFPALPICYGWTKLSLDEIKLLPSWLSRDLHPDGSGCVFGIIYEYIPAQMQDLDIGQVHLDFFYAVGFIVHPYRPDDWHGGRLIDISDVWSVFGRSWDGRDVVRRDAKEWFWTRDYRKNATVVRPDWRRRIQELTAQKPDSASSDESNDEESE